MNSKSFSVVREVAKQLGERVAQRFPRYGTTTLLHSLGNYLDPVFRGVHLELVDELDTVKEAVRRTWDREEEVVEGQVNVEDIPEDDDSDLTSRLLRERRMRCKDGRRNNAGHKTTKLDLEMDAYENLPDTPRDVKRLSWWNENKEKFPILSVAAREVSVFGIC